MVVISIESSTGELVAGPMLFPEICVWLRESGGPYGRDTRNFQKSIAKER